MTKIYKVPTWTLLDDWHSDYHYLGSNVPKVAFPKEGTPARTMLEFSHKYPIVGIMVVGVIRIVIACAHIIFHFLQALASRCEKGAWLYMAKAFCELCRGIVEIIPGVGYLLLLAFNPLDIQQQKEREFNVGGFRVEPIPIEYEAI